MSDFLRLTGESEEDIRVHYNTIDVIIAQTRFVGDTEEYTSKIKGSRLMLGNATSLWVRESPDYIEHLIDALSTQFEMSPGEDESDDDE